MAKFIPVKFTPSEADFSALRKDGICADFCDYILPHFREYWEDLKEQKLARGKKSSWSTTFRVWARRAFRGRVGAEYEQIRHQRRDHGGRKDDLFADVLDKINGSAPDMDVTRVRQAPPSDRSQPATAAAKCNEKATRAGRDRRPTETGQGGIDNTRVCVDHCPVPSMSSEDAFAEINKILGNK